MREPASEKDAPNGNYREILDHFATAYFDIYLKGDRAEWRICSPTILPAHDERNASERPAGTTPPDPGLKGFKPRTAVGLILEHAAAGR